MDAGDGHIAYVLLATRSGQVGLVDDKIYADLGQTRAVAATYQAEEESATDVHYSVGVIVPLEHAR